MLVNLIKFIHLLCVLGLVGCVLFCTATIIFRKTAGIEHSISQQLGRFSRAILGFSGVAMLTGTLLVYPKAFTFHTPWIQAAYILVLSFILTVVLLKRQIGPGKTMTPNKCVLFQLAYLGLFILLIVIIHDAVTKTTFIL